MRRPKEQPVAVVHFIGGAAVGSLPLVYKTFLETLPSNLLIICTPYKLNLDYLQCCDSIITSFSTVAYPLSEEFGPLPVYGVGHSLGAVLQCLISSLFPATPRAGNVLIGYGTRTIEDSVGSPDLYSNVVLPLTSVLSPGTKAVEGILKVGYELSVGKVPEDSLVNGLLRDLSVPGVGGESLTLPTEIRSTLQAFGDLVGNATTEEGKAVSGEVLRTLVQFPHVVGDVGKGGEIFPDSKGIGNSIVKGYKSRRTLVLEYDDDGIGENGKLLPLVMQAAEIQRTRDSMRKGMEVDFKVRAGAKDSWREGRLE